MSFRTRLAGFFVLIVVVPMVAVGFLVFRLIGDSEQGKANARANAIATEAASVYEYASRGAQLDAQTIPRDPVVRAAIARATPTWRAPTRSPSASGRRLRASGSADLTAMAS